MVLTTPLNDEHVRLGATFTDFGGWNMPVRYGSDLDEHHAVRKSAGLFDISHMGELRVTGPEAAKFLDELLVSNIGILKIGQAKYTMICAKDGGIIDDLIVYRLDLEDFMVVANASNRHAVLVAMQNQADRGYKMELQDQTEDWGLIALQGPKAVEILQAKISVDLESLPYYWIEKAQFGSIEILVARTGYTGEDGFELFVPDQHVVQVWREVLEVGGEQVVPCGLAARDTLRLEAGMPLYGHELNEMLTPFEVNLGRVIAFDKGDFVSRTELFKAGNHTLRQKLYGLKGEGRRAARADYEIFMPGDETPIGKVTSGVLSPTLGYPIAMALLDGSLNLPIGTVLEADVRGTRVAYEVVKLPFYKKSER